MPYNFEQLSHAHDKTLTDFSVCSQNYGTFTQEGTDETSCIIRNATQPSSDEHRDPDPGVTWSYMTFLLIYDCYIYKDLTGCLQNVRNKRTGMICNLMDSNIKNAVYDFTGLMSLWKMKVDDCHVIWTINSIVIGIIQIPTHNLYFNNSM